MKFLMLVDMSPLTIMLSELGKELTRRGHVVEWACESRIPIIKYDLDIGKNATFLTDFTEAGCKVKNSFGNVGYIMFPNYDRDYELGLHRPGRYGYETANEMLAYFDQIFSKSDPDCVVYENVSNSFSYAAYLIAKKYNKRYMGLIGSRIPGRFEIWPSPFGIQDHIIREMNKGEGRLGLEADEFSRKCVDEKRPPIPDYMKNNPSSYKKKYILHYIGKIAEDPDIFKKIFNPVVRKEGDVSRQTPPLFDQVLARLKRNLRRKITLWKLDKMFVDPDLEERYLIYPLHYHPESSTSVLSPAYVDEDVVIKNIAFNLPDNVLLYVKDHPNAAGFKGLSYYRRICSLPNVRLIDYRFPTNKLLEKSEGVVTLTSTMGFEALLHEKPVYCLGEAFYTPHRMCFKLRSAFDLKKAYNDFQKNRFGCSDFREENLKFVRSYYLSTYEGRLIIERKSQSPEMTRKIANALESALNVSC